MNILDTIVAQKRRELARLPTRTVRVADLRAARAAVGPTRDFLAALRQPRRGDIALIAEVKKASPSAGVLCPDFDPARLARAYQAAGASCISVLTDEVFFQGALTHLRQVRAAVELPLLRKDFILDERQVLEAVEWGADAVLLIAAILEDRQLGRLHELASGAGLAVLIEVHDEAELDRALGIGARLIGVNNRDLHTFRVDVSTTERLAARLARAAGKPAAPLLVAESGLRTRADVERVRRAGAAAILVGESLVRSGDIASQVRALIGPSCA